MTLNEELDLAQLGVGPREKRTAEPLLGADRRWERWRRKHGRHHVDARDP